MEQDRLFITFSAYKKHPVAKMDAYLHKLDIPFCLQELLGFQFAEHQKAWLVA